MKFLVCVLLAPTLVVSPSGEPPDPPVKFPEPSGRMISKSQFVEIEKICKNTAETEPCDAYQKGCLPVCKKSGGRCEKLTEANKEEMCNPTCEKCKKEKKRKKQKKCLRKCLKKAKQYKKKCSACGQCADETKGTGEGSGDNASYCW